MPDAALAVPPAQNKLAGQDVHLIRERLLGDALVVTPERLDARTWTPGAIERRPGNDSLRVDPVRVAERNGLLTPLSRVVGKHIRQPAVRGRGRLRHVRHGSTPSEFWCGSVNAE